MPWIAASDTSRKAEKWMAEGAKVLTQTPIETDVAFPATVNIKVLVGLATETDAAFAALAGTAVGLPVETDTVFPATVRVVVTPGFATETDTIPTAGLTLPTGTALETDSVPATPVGPVIFSGNLTGVGTLDGYDEVVVNPEFRIQVEDKVVEQAPTAITISMFGGAAETAVTFKIDGITVYTTSADSEGTVLLTSLPLTAAIGSVGTHIVSATQTLYGSPIITTDTFTVTRAPAMWPGALVSDAQAVNVAGAIAHNTRHWVFQDLMPGGLGSYVLPISPDPRKTTSPHYEYEMSAKATTSPAGQFHVFQARAKPHEWKFGGYCPSQAMQEKILQYRYLNRRFYIIDHHNRAWKCVIVNAEFIPRLRHSYNGVVSDWGSDYTVTAMVLDQDWVTPA